MSPRELREVAVLFAEKLNLSRGPVKIVIPLLGWSSVDAPGNATYDPQEDRIFTTELRKVLKKEIEIVEVDANMEDPHFAHSLIRIALDMFKEVLSHA